MSSAQSTRPSLGLPPRPPTVQTALWEQILRPNKESTPAPSLQNMPIIAPPLAPLDKNATSMRVLLHDTQANFEKFAKHVGQLLHEVKETHTEIKSTHSLFERDRESLVGDMLDLVNRSQKEIQKSVGAPSQQDAVDTLFKDVNHRLGGLDQRLEAIQSFNQTHSQALQNQMQAIQILLDKQGSIIAAVVPLLPLVQAIPLHIDAAKSSLSESLTDMLSSPKAVSVSVSPPSVAPAVPEFRSLLNKKRSRPDTGAASSSVSPVRPLETSPKKPRLEVPDRQGSASMRNTLWLPSSRSYRPDTSSSPLKGLKGTGLLRRLASNATISSPEVEAAITRPAPLSSASRRGTFAIPSTPRRPLGDLPISTPAPAPALTSLPRRSSSKRHPDPMEDALMKASLERSKSLAPPLFAASKVKVPGMTPNPSRPPRILRVQENNVRRSLSVVSVTSDAVPTPAPDAASTAAQDPIPKPEPLHEEDIQRHLSPRSTTVVPSVPATPRVTSSGILARSRDPLSARMEPARPRPISALPSFMVEGSSSAPKDRSSSVPLAVVLGKQKERRSPAREGRRFIPLVDSDDEEE